MFFVSDSGGRIFVAEGYYYENLVLNQDVQIEAVESARGRVTIAFNTLGSDIPTVDIKVYATCALTCLRDDLIKTALSFPRLEKSHSRASISSTSPRDKIFGTAIAPFPSKAQQV